MAADFVTYSMSSHALCADAQTLKHMIKRYSLAIQPEGIAGGAVTLMYTLTFVCYHLNKCYRRGAATLLPVSATLHARYILSGILWIIKCTFLNTGVLHGGRPGREAVFLKQRKGFVRVAIQTGAGMLSTFHPSLFRPGIYVTAAAGVAGHKGNLKHATCHSIRCRLCPQTSHRPSFMKMSPLQCRGHELM